MPFAVEIKDLRKNYKGSWAPALDGFSFCVEQNHVVGLLGPNGAGKTTCISIISGIAHQDSGTAYIFGKDTKSDIVAIRKTIGLVPQQIALFGELTAIENLRYIGRLYGLQDKIINERAMELLTRLGLEKHANKKINNYSGGMKRRANIIASLLHQPQLLILDEPTAGVDVQSRALILGFLSEYRGQGKTILYTSHLLDEAEQICDEVIIIDEGKFITAGTPKELISNTDGCTRLEEVFLHHTGRNVRD